MQAKLSSGRANRRGQCYVVEEGRLRAFIEENGYRNYRTYLRKGDFFGEVSLFKGVPRTATIEAVSPCKLLQLRPETFAKLAADYPDFRVQIESRIAQYDYKKTARVPLDFADEVLPADVAAHRKVGPEQLTEDDQASHRDAPYASREGYFIKKRRKLGRFPFVHQIDAMDCGAACLGMVCRYFGRSVSVTRIRQLVHTATDGTSLKALCRAAEELGLAARSVKASEATLSQLPLPAIVHWEGNHWVVLYSVGRKDVCIADPAMGLRRLPREEFLARWTRYAALFDYTTEFEKTPESKRNAAWLLPFIRPHLGTVFKAVCLAVVVGALQMLLPIFTQVIVDRVLVESDVTLLQVLVIGMVVVVALSIVAMVVQRYLLSFSAVRIDASTLDFMTRRLLALPISYFSTRQTGDIQRRLGGMRQIREFAVQSESLA